VLLTVHVQEVVVDRYLVLLEERDRRLVDLKHDNPQVMVKGVYLLLSVRDFVRQLSDTVDFSLFRGEERFKSRLPLVELFELFLIIFSLFCL